MSDYLKEVLSYCEKTNLNLAKKISSLIIKSGLNLEIIKYAQSVLSEEIDINISEMESLVNPEKFEFPEPNIGEIIV